MTDRKSGPRAAVRASRAQAPLATEDAARLVHFLPLLPKEPGVIATYASTHGEPGTHNLIAELANRGWEVRLPVLKRQVDWARFDGNLRPGWNGIPEPTGPRLGAESLRECDIVIVSCLQVSRSGYRLGVGGGWYDRALLHRRDDALVLAWARDAEVVDEVPTEPHDQPVDGFVTESGAVLLSSPTRR